MKIKVYVVSAKTYSGVHFDASGVNNMNVYISPWTEPEVNTINRLGHHTYGILNVMILAKAWRA